MSSKYDVSEISRLRYLERAHRRISDDTETAMRDMKTRSHSQARDLKKLIHQMHESQSSEDTETWKRIDEIIDGFLHL